MTSTMKSTTTPTGMPQTIAGRPRPLPLVRHSLILAGRSLIKTRRNPGLLLDALILPIMFLLLFVYLFGGAVSGSSEAYLQYIFPGVLVLTTILAGQVSTGLSIVQDMKKGVFDRFRSMPIARSAPLVGSVLGDSIRYLVAVAVLFGLGYLIGFRVETDPLSALTAIALAIVFGFALSWIAVLAAVVLRNENLVSTVAFLLPFPLVFGTSMAAPPETMPNWLQTWVDINPVSHAIDASRGLLLGGPVAGPIAMTLLWSMIFLAAFAPLAMWVHRRRM
jgi:oleandomycin transport system permease protein